MRNLVLACLLAGFVGSIAGVAVTRQGLVPAAWAQAPQPNTPGPVFGGPPADPAAAQLEADLAELTAEERVSVAVYNDVNRAVAHINTRGARVDGFFLFEIPSQGSGSGIVLDQQGHVLTNYHVVEDARQIEVTLHDSSTYPAQVVGHDLLSDLAVLKIEAPGDSLAPIALGDSARLHVGQRVFAIGNPFGLERTLTTGVISSLNRSLPSLDQRRLKSMIQIDAAINPGNSGGPLVDTRGRLIGINTAIASRSGQSAGVGFAIPINTIKRIVPQLIEGGHVVRPDVGIEAVYQTDAGLRIAKMTAGGPAEQAGLRGPQVVRKQRGPIVYERVERTAADVIVGVNGQATKTVDDFLDSIEPRTPGTVVNIDVLRGGQVVQVPVRLGQTD